MKKILIGIFIGVISGLFSAGGGLILVPIFTYLFNMEEKNARATTLFCILPMVVTTAIIYKRNNFLDWKLGITCAIGGVIGGIIGGKLLNKISNKMLQVFFILFLFYAGFNLIMR
jgi:uncharacterized membrane protein YfcA